MNLNLTIFKKKAAKGKDAPLIELVSDEAGQKGLVFGLFWRKLVTSGGRDQAIKLARAANATHYIFRLQQTGTGKLAGKPDELPRRIYPASVIAARHFMGDSLCLLELGGGDYWIALTRNGQPTSVDFVLKDTKPNEALSEARRVLAENSEEEGRISVYTNIEHHGLESARELAVFDLFDAAIDEDEALLQLPKAKASIPKPVIYMAGLVGAALVAQSGYKLYENRVRAKLNALQNAQGVDPHAAWTEVIERWKGSASAPDPHGLDVPRKSIDDLFVDWRGWSLSDAICKAGVFSNGFRDWSCKATYKRLPGGMLAENLIQEIPATWVPSFSPLNDLELSWTVKQPSSQIDLAAIEPAEKVKLQFISQLQRLQSALVDEPKFTFQPIPLDAPRGIDGSALGADARMAGLSKADLVIKGPLRSIDAVTNTGLHVDWVEISISRGQDGGIPTLRTSQITAQASGVIYAKK